MGTYHAHHAASAPVIVYGYASSTPPVQRRLGGWLISAGIHASVLAVAWVMVSAVPRIVDQDPLVTRTVPLAVPETKIEKPQPVRAMETQPEIPQQMETETPAVTNPEVAEVPTADNEETNEVSTASDPSDTIAEAATGSSGFVASIGSGSGGGSIFSGRTGPNHKAIAIAGGANHASENAVERSLRWFKRHQSPNGAWESDKYYLNCFGGVKSEPGKLHPVSDANIAMTGYALLCFLGYGCDHKAPGKYRTAVKKGIDWLLMQQRPDGYFGRTNYEHPIAVMALAEAYAMTSDPALRAAVQKGVDQILAHQNHDATPGTEGYVGGLGWDYTKPNDRNDASVTGWNIMALKSALVGGFNVGKGMEGGRQWLERHWLASNSTSAPERPGDQHPWKKAQDITPYDRSRFFYTWHDRDDKLEGAAGRESIGLACAIFLGRLQGDRIVESLANTVTQTQMPTSFPTNIYYLYYNTLAVFQLGGERWTKWNATVRDLLVNAQCHTDDCRDGSWDWQESRFTGSDLGRVLSTAYNTLSLQVYYRYRRIAELHAK
jgi:Squalene-hopene cyclase C-terminal domain